MQQSTSVLPFSSPGRAKVIIAGVRASEGIDLVPRTWDQYMRSRHVLPKAPPTAAATKQSTTQECQALSAGESKLQ